MSIDTPNPAGQIEKSPAAAHRWYHRVTALLFIVFCLEIGVVLLVFPWSDYWENNFFTTWTPRIRDFLDSSYVRGGVSGLGAVNVFISFTELFRLRRFSRSQ